MNIVIAIMDAIKILEMKFRLKILFEIWLLTVVEYYTCLCSCINLKMQVRILCRDEVIASYRSLAVNLNFRCRAA